MDFNDADTSAASSLISPHIWNCGLASFNRIHIVEINWLWDIPGSPLQHPWPRWC